MIEAMKQALEALKKDSPWREETITSLRQAIKQAKSVEPVAVVNSTISGHIDWLCVVFPKQGTKLYTTPQPQREWVGLTDEEERECWTKSHDEDGWLDVEKMIELREAKLKERNHVS